jgi:hypothetical protein
MSRLEIKPTFVVNLARGKRLENERGNFEFLSKQARNPKMFNNKSRHEFEKLKNLRQHGEDVSFLEPFWCVGERLHRLITARSSKKSDFRERATETKSLWGLVRRFTPSTDLKKAKFICFPRWFLSRATFADSQINPGRILFLNFARSRVFCLNCSR